jgi:hypothetical protein
VYNLTTFVNKLSEPSKLSDLVKAVKASENSGILVFDDHAKLKSLQFEEWFKNAFNLSDGLWIGKGLSEQSLFRLATLTKEMSKDMRKAGH